MSVDVPEYVSNVTSTLLGLPQQTPMTPASHAERQSHVTAAARKVAKRRSLQGWTKGPGGELPMKLA